MKDHAGILGSLAAPIIVATCGMVLVIHGAKDDTTITAPTPPTAVSTTISSTAAPESVVDPNASKGQTK